MKKIKLSEASKPLAEYAVELSEEAHSTSKAFMEIIEGARAEIKAGKTLCLVEMKRAVLL